MKILNIKTTSLLAATLFAGGAAQAQPDLNNTPKATNPAPTDWNAMTPAQQRVMVQGKVGGMLREAMTHIGTTDQEVQDAVVVTMIRQDEIYEPVRERHAQIAQTLIDNAASEEQVAALMTELRVASDKAREARDGSIADLENQIGFTSKPRLNALLTMVGLIGHEGIHMGGVATEIGKTLGNLAAVQAGKKAAK